MKEESCSRKEKHFSASLSEEPKSTGVQLNELPSSVELRGSIKGGTFAWMSLAGIAGNGNGCSQHAES